MFEPVEFDVEIVRTIDPRLLRWPSRGEAGGEGNLGCNRLYADLRRLSWAEAKSVLAIEAELIKRIETADDVDEEYDVIEEERYEGDDLFGLDIGVASTVTALSAAGCVPFTSCNAGAFGGTHNELYPLVGFFARRRMTSPLLTIAKQTRIGLENSSAGCVVAFAKDVCDFPQFAAAIIREKNCFVASRPNTQRAPENQSLKAEQIKLSL